MARARVPRPTGNDYVRRPEWQVVDSSLPFIKFGRFLSLQFSRQNEADLSKIKKKEATKLDR